MEIDIWGPIVPHGQEERMGDFSSLQMKLLLDMAKGEDIHVRMQSIGGSVVEGLAIYNLLRAHDGKVTTENMGISGSIASIIFLAGEVRIANLNSKFMIHEARGARAEDLDKTNRQMASIYSNATGESVEFFLDAMKKETMYDGQETFDLGFATELGGELKAVALMDFYERKPQQTVKEPQMAMTDKEKAEFEALKAENETLKTEQEAKADLVAEKDAEIEKIKAEKETEIQNAILAEKERETGILASILHPKQEAFAKELVAEGKDLVGAKLSIMENFQANKAEYMKVEASEQASILDSQAPQATQGGEVAEVSKDELYKEYRALKNQGEYAKAEQFFNEKLK